MRWIAIFLWMCLLHGSLYAQTEYAPTFRFRGDNDYISLKVRGGDRYYTGGLYFGVDWQVRRLNFLDHLMLSLPDSCQRMRGLQLAQVANTPAELGTSGILDGDYPYAGLLVLSYGNRTLAQGYALSSTLTAGVLGPASLAGDFQEYLHSQIIRSNIPQGWRFQIPSDFVLGYQLQFDGIFFQARRVELLGSLETNVGFLYNNFKLGGIFRLGRFTSYLDPDSWLFRRRQHKRQPRQFFMQLRPQLTMVFGNVMLEGGAFRPPGDPGNPDYYYHVDRDRLERLLYGYAWSLHYVGRAFSLTFVQQFQTAEIKGLPAHEWAGLVFSFRL